MAVAARRGRPRRQYRCIHCAKTFKRSEHCIRHERTHTNEKPFACRHCNKAYSRKDLVTRHERTLHANTNTEQAGAQVVNVNVTPPGDSGMSDDSVAGDGGDVNDGGDGTASNEISSEISNEIGHQPLDYSGMTISVAEQSPSLMLHADDCIPNQADQESIGSSNSRNSRNTGSVTSTATGSTPSQQSQSFRTSSEQEHSEHSEHMEQMDDISLAEPDMDLLFDINSPIQIDSHAPERMPKERHPEHTSTLQHEQIQIQIPSTPPVTTANGNGTKPATATQQEQAPIPLSTYMDLDFSGFMYTANPNEEYSSLAPDLGPFQLPSPLSLLSGLVYPTATATASQQPTTPQLALDTSREFHDATDNAGEYMSQTTSASASTSAPTSTSTSTARSRSRSRPGSGPESRTLAATPVLIRDGQRSFPSFSIDGGIHLAIKNDLAQRLGDTDSTDSTDSIDAGLPSPRMCADFLASYVSNFHGHLPIIHIATFSPATQPSPLVLIICSIGALYRLDRKRSRRLFELSRRAMDGSDVSTDLSQSQSQNQPVIVKGHPLWSVQTRVLQTFYALMTGDMSLTMAAMRENGFYTVVYHEARTSLQGQRREHRCDSQSGRDNWDNWESWESWVVVESWKRLLGAMLICSTMIVVVFNQNPGMNSTMDLEFDALDSEKAWGAQSAAEWCELCEANRQEAARHEYLYKKPRTMKGILTDIMSDRWPTNINTNTKSLPAPAYEVSAFSAFILMHAIVVHMWQRAQVLQALVSHAPSPTEKETGTDTGTDTEDSFHHMLMHNGLQTLARCQAFLDGARYGGGHGSSSDSTNSTSDILNPEKEDVDDDAEKDDIEKDDIEKEASLVFNANAILRIAHVRLFRPDSIHSSIDLTNLHGNRTDASIDMFVSSTMERGTLVLQAVEKAFEGLREPVRIGHLFVRKTAAFRWSVEQAVAGWDCALLVSKFVHAIEMDVLDNKTPTADERLFCDKVKDVLREAEADVEEGASVAAVVAKTWSWFLRDVWIWGLTPVMGEALDQVGKAYTRALASKAKNQNTI